MKALGLSFNLLCKTGRKGGGENDVRKKEYNISCKVFTHLRGDIDMNSPESGTPYKLFKPKIIISNEIFLVFTQIDIMMLIITSK